MMCIRTKNPRKLNTKWKYVNSGVFENEHGDRVHLGGRLIKLNESKSFNVSGCVVFQNCCKLMGCARRGLMLYAEYYREVQA